MNKKKYECPDFVPGEAKSLYGEWLKLRTNSVFNRDKRRGELKGTRAEYKKAIHKAALESGGKDFYTGKQLRWKLILQYVNEESKRSARVYRTKFYDLPTVDHHRIDSKRPQFVICAWIVNDMKNDLSPKEFVKRCEEVLGYSKKQRK